MQVLHVISGIDPRAGGTATALLALAPAQRRAGIGVSVVATFVTPEESASQQLLQEGIAVHQVGPCNPRLCRHPDIIPTLQSLIPSADVVHIHALWEEIQHQAARICQQQRVAYVITPHGMLDPWSLSQGWLKKKVYLALRMRRNLDRAGAMHFTTETERDLVKPMRLHPPVIVEPNGVDLHEFASLPARGTFRSRYPELRDRPVVIFLGRLHYKKGFDLLIPAFARGAPAEAMLVVVGPDDDNYRATIEGMAEQNRIGDRVIFTAMLRGRERVEALVDADLFVLPSYQENFGIAVVESLAAGCPVIISDQVNIHRQITEAKVGAVVPTRIEPLADEIRKWTGDRELRRAASERAIPFVKEHYDRDVIGRHWVKHYERLAAK